MLPACCFVRKVYRNGKICRGFPVSARRRAAHRRRRFPYFSGRSAAVVSNRLHYVLSFPVRTHFGSRRSRKKALFAGKAVDGAGEVCYTTICVDACVAQLAEQLTRNEQVAGSNPATSSKKATPDRVLLFLLSLSGVEVYPPSRGKSGHKLPKATPERVLLSCLKRQLDTLHMKCRLVGTTADL